MAVNVAPGSIPTVGISQQSSAYTFGLGDAYTQVQSTSATAVTFTIPANASVALAVGAWIEILQYGTGQVTIAAAAGVTLDSPAGLLDTHQQYSTIRLHKIGTNEWVLAGDLA